MDDGFADLRRAMSTKAIQRKADELLSFGMTKQQVFDNLLLELPEAKPKKVADLVRYRPTLWSRERYRSMHLAVLTLIAASAVLRVLGPVLKHSIRMDMPTTYLTLVPIASLLLGYSLYRWQGQVFEWVGWANLAGAFGLLNAIRQLDMEAMDLGVLSVKVMSVAIGALSLYLARKVFSKPQEVLDPLGQVPSHYLFPAEGTE
jgi:predicted outer membrane lipoprotein